MSLRLGPPKFSSSFDVKLDRFLEFEFESAISSFLFCFDDGHFLISFYFFFAFPRFSDEQDFFQGNSFFPILE